MLAESCTVLAASEPIEAVVSSVVARDEVEAGATEPEVPVAEAAVTGVLCEPPELEEEHLETKIVSLSIPHSRLTLLQEAKQDSILSQQSTLLSY